MGVWRLVEDALAEPEDKALFLRAYNAIKSEQLVIAYNRLQKHPHFYDWKPD